ncbi:MAG: MmgE/PrpD family protein [Acidiferrobacterales bacterium]
MKNACVVDFLHDLKFEHLPQEVFDQTQRAIRDLVATAAGGFTTPLAAIVRNYCARHLLAADRGARMIFDGRRVSRTGAALAGGMIIDSFDAHDGHRVTKGHAGVAVLPAVLAYVDSFDATPSTEFVTATVVAYEVAMRAGVGLHRTAADYHTSGAWSAIGVAALGARMLGLDRAETRHALGIAEYHGPRSQMMRCIDYPTMLKDGSGWGAMAGVAAADLAADGFTGAPAVLCESDEVRDLWSDLGQRWYLLEMYFKPYPVCRWAQPAIEAALSLQRTHGLAARDLARVEVATFYEATRLDTRLPTTTEEAQYSLPFPLAAVLVSGKLGAAEVVGDTLHDVDIRRLSEAIVLTEDPELSERFPAERLAHVTLHTKDGRVLASGVTGAKGDPEYPLADRELEEKFFSLTEPLLGPARARAVNDGISQLNRGDISIEPLLDLLLDSATLHERVVTAAPAEAKGST